MSIEAMKQALEALEHANAGDPRWKGSIKMAKENLRQAIEQAVKEKADFEDFVAKVQAVEKEACEIINREWVGLTSAEMDFIQVTECETKQIILAAEAKLKGKNHG